jgi:hypothetical protein
MIFRWLYKRKMTRAFGRFVPENTINDLTAGQSEWQSFKSLLPSAISRPFSTPVMSDHDALQTLQKLIRDTLRDAPDLAVNKPSARNSPPKPN